MLVMCLTQWLSLKKITKLPPNKSHLAWLSYQWADAAYVRGGVSCGERWAQTLIQREQCGAPRGKAWTQLEEGTATSIVLHLKCCCMWRVRLRGSGLPISTVILACTEAQLLSSFETCLCRTPPGWALVGVSAILFPATKKIWTIYTYLCMYTYIYI